MKNIEVKCTIKNGSLVTEANAPKLKVIGVKGSLHKTIVGTDVDTKNYSPLYELVKETEGWIAREVTFNTGIVGHTKTLRQQIINISLMGRHSIIFSDE